MLERRVVGGRAMYDASGGELPPRRVNKLRMGTYVALTVSIK
jgi:hypothetical protein